MDIFSYDAALKSSVSYFNEDELAAKVFLDKYALRDNDGNLIEDAPDKMHSRLAKEFARIEQKKFKNPLSEEKLFGLFDKFKYIIPQGSILYGCGNTYQIVSLSNCYVIESPVDSYGGILLADQHLVQISKRRGGVGTDLSTLRPSGSRTKNASRSSTGIPSWMHRYSNTIREVGQGGRRGALILTISVHHPDILYFATIKNDDKNVTGANISVRLSNEFLKAVDNNTEYELRFPVNSTNVVKRIKAREVWKTIIHSAWLRAEPGLLFWDNVVNYNAVDCYDELGFETIGTNPCQPGWATVLTPDGIRTINDVNVGDSIWSECGWTKIINKSDAGIKDVNAYNTTFGTFYGTENHKIIQDGEKVEVCKADSIDLLRGDYIEKVDHDTQVIMDGLLIGDGTVHAASNDLICLIIGDNDSDYFHSEISNLIIRERFGISEKYWEVITSLIPTDITLTYKRIVPDKYFFSDTKTKCSFLRGLYSANGSVVDGRVTLKSASLNLIKQVQIMLSSIGIASYYTTNQPKNVKFKNGIYPCKQSYDLNITRDRVKFKNLIGFIQIYKNAKLFEYLNKQSSKPEASAQIRSINYVSTEQVYDLTVDNSTHTYWSGGLNVANCGELPLCANDSCRLLILNLFSYVKNPFSSAPEFDYELFYDHAKLAQRLMDDVIDLELEKIDQIIAKIMSDPESDAIKDVELKLWQSIRVKCENGRRTGLGITAMGDTLAALNIGYATEESLPIVDKIFKTFKIAALDSSCEMAEELGPFPIWDWNREKDSLFLLQLKEDAPEIYERISRFGRRNIGHLTIAPTGSMSLLTQTTSGIEPLFRLTPYTRRKKINPNDENVRVDFIDQSGDHWQEFDVYHPKVQMWMDISGKVETNQSPWYNYCAEDIDWINRVKLQAIAQRHIDHAISSTINLPENVTEDEVAQIYLAAWKYNLKGITVYRDGSRTGVLVDKTDSKKQSTLSFAKRPRELLTDIYHVTVKGKPHTVCVSLLNKHPYEVLLIADKVKGSVSSGKIVKYKKGHYDLCDSDGELIYPNITESCTSEEANITRFISMSLRHNIPLDYIHDQLSKSAGDINSLAKSIGRCLKKYIPENTKSNEPCPECGCELIYQEGCKKCVCGWSKC